MLRYRTYRYAISIGGKCSHDLDTRIKSVEKFNLDENRWVYVSERTLKDSFYLCNEQMNGKISVNRGIAKQLPCWTWTQEQVVWKKLILIEARGVYVSERRKEEIENLNDTYAAFARGLYGKINLERYCKDIKLFILLRVTVHQWTGFVESIVGKTHEQ